MRTNLNSTTVLGGLPSSQVMVELRQRRGPCLGFKAQSQLPWVGMCVHEVRAHAVGDQVGHEAHQYRCLVVLVLHPRAVPRLCCNHFCREAHREPTTAQSHCIGETAQGFLTPPQMSLLRLLMVISLTVPGAF